MTKSIKIRDLETVSEAELPEQHNLPDSSLLSSKGVTNGCCNYPKIFKVDPTTLDGWGRQRSAECAGRTERLRYAEPFSEWTWGDWHDDYMCQAWNGNEMNWEILERFHNRFLEQVKRDAVGH